MRAFAKPARTATLLAAAAAVVLATAGSAGAEPRAAEPIERRLYSDTIDASSFLWNDWNKFVENYHPNYVADDDPATAWVEGARSSGAGEWLRIQLTSLDRTTRIRLRVRNGYQKSQDLWKANARARDVTVRLLPSKTEKRVTLTDTDGWQELVVVQPSGPVRAIELAIGSVYEGSKYADLCISDVQVFATSETPDNPAFEKSKLASLMSWKAARVAAAQLFAARKVELPIYPAYETESAGDPPEDGFSSDLLAAAAKDPGFAREWKDALAAAVALTRNPGSMTRAQIAPRSPARLVAVDGLQIAGIYDALSGAGAYPRGDAIRLPMLGLVSALFADQLRVLDVKDSQTIAQYQKSPRGCGADTAWVARRQPKEGPARVTAIMIARCQRMEGRSGAYIGSALELMIYDATGKLVLVSGKGYLEAYRWTTEAGRPMLAGGRSLVWESGVIEAKRRVAAGATGAAGAAE